MLKHFVRKWPLHFLLCIICTGSVCAQPNIHPQSRTYQWPEDSLVRARLDHWQDLKFGMIIHWGLYAQAGILESWNLCSEDWVNRDSSISYDAYKKLYWGLMDSFNPIHFDPEQWAEAGKKAGMKYLVFTTKHHDGFNMFDTRQTNFKISAGPFKDNSKSDVAKYVFEAFRKKGFMIGAYYSKPDWHSEYYWWPRYATPDRYNNYDIRKFPWRWQQFQTFTYNQISELMHNYGSIDILWLDGGWVRPLESVDDEVRGWGARIPEWDQGINIPAIAGMARKAQPGLIIVDRTVHGPYENYQTPEQRIPETQLNYPWESCMTLANNWGYVPGDHFKSSATVIHALIEIVAKGGSLLLGVGPKPDGLLSEEAVQHLKEIGVWLEKNGAAIYNTRTTKNFHDGNVWFTQNPKLGYSYALVCLNDSSDLPIYIEWTQNAPARGTMVNLLETGKPVTWTREGDLIKIILPADLLKEKRKYPALAFSFIPEKKDN